MASVRTFRWPSGGGFDVVDGEVFHFRNGKRGGVAESWTLKELEGFANSADSLQETTPKVRAEVYTARVLLVNGEVTELEDAKVLRDQLTQAIAQFEGENVSAQTFGIETTVAHNIDRANRTARQEPDFPGQILVQGTWTAADEGDGWVRTSFGTPAGSHPDKRLYVKIETETLRSVLSRHDRNNNW